MLDALNAFGVTEDRRPTLMASRGCDDLCRSHVGCHHVFHLDERCPCLDKFRRCGSA